MSLTLNLHVEAIAGPQELDVLVALYNDRLDSSTSRAKEAIRDIKVLIVETAMPGFDPNQLAGVKDG